MSDVIFVGNKAQNIYAGASVPKITRVNLVVDSDHMYTVGNDTGRTIEVECPWGTQAMASNILANLSGIEYAPYTAERTLLDPAFEIGDAVRIGGVYSVIADADCTYNAAGLVNIGAPDLDEIDDEYPAQQTQNNSIKRQIAYTRSLISKTSEQIRLEVQGVEDEISYIQLDLDKITSRVQDAEGNIATLELTANSLRSEINGKIDGDYAQTLIDQTLEGIELSVSSSKGSTTFKIKADGATLSSKTLDLTVDAVNITGKLKASQIDADELEVDAANVTGILTAKSLGLDGLLELTEDGDVYGYLGVNEVKGGPVMSDTSGNVGVVVTNNAAKISYREDAMIWVARGGCYSSYTMQVYSDRRLKNSISYDLSKAEALYPLLKPCSFLMNSDRDGRENWGFVAQEVIESAKAVGMDVAKLALIGGYGGMYSLAEGHLIALNTHMIQKLMVRMDALEGKKDAV